MGTKMVMVVVDCSEHGVKPSVGTIVMTTEWSE